MTINWESEEEFEDYLWAVCDVGFTIAEAISGVDGLGHAGQVGPAQLGPRKHVRRLWKRRNGGTGLRANPFFEKYQIDGAGEDYTMKYLRNRVFKSTGGAVFSFGSSVATAVTVVDAGGIAKDGQAVALSSLHHLKLSAIANKHQRGKLHQEKGTVGNWIDLVCLMKKIKMTTRAVGAVAAAIPLPGVGPVAKCLKAALKIDAKLEYGAVCRRVAMELHWRAYQEAKLGAIHRAKKRAVGPATEILYELFTKRGATRIFGKYDVDRIIKEEAGWNAVVDKLMLI